MNYIHKGEYIGTPGIPEKQFNQIEDLVYEYRNRCGCRKLHEFEWGIQHHHMKLKEYLRKESKYKDDNMNENIIQILVNEKTKEIAT